MSLGFWLVLTQESTGGSWENGKKGGDSQLYSFLWATGGIPNTFLLSRQLPTPTDKPIMISSYHREPCALSFGKTISALCPSSPEMRLSTVIKF